MELNYARYLSAKSTVDDRALNEKVLKCFDELLRNANLKQTLRIVEIGAGTGSMLIRFLSREMTKYWPPFEYTLVDIKLELLHSARRRLISGVSSQEISSAKSPESCEPCRVKDSQKSPHLIGSTCDCANPKPIPSLKLRTGDVIFVVDDALRHLNSRPNAYDVVVAAAFMDIVSLSQYLPVIVSSLDPSRGVCAFYAPINFDGVTDLRPSSSEGADFDRTMERDFHDVMKRGVAGTVSDQHISGRRLLVELPKFGMDVCCSGGSSWIVYPRNKLYHADEAYFLQCIVWFIEHALLGQSEPDGVGSNRIRRYIKSRRKQIEDGELCYVAHNIDICAVIRST